MKVVIINGSAGVGKDTFCEKVAKKCNSKSYSSVEMVKRVALELGWNGVKDEKNRKMLSDLKKFIMDYNDGPFQDMKKVVEECRNEKGILFLHIREIDEIKRAKKEFDAITCLVRNKNVEHITSNASDRDVYKMVYDIEIENNGTLEDLDREVDLFLRFISCVRSEGSVRDAVRSGDIVKSMNVPSSMTELSRIIAEVCENQYPLYLLGEGNTAVMIPEWLWYHIKSIMKWTPCSERQPSEFKRYLVTEEGRGYSSDKTV